jgi:hypothetical protein
MTSASLQLSMARAAGPEIQNSRPSTPSATGLQP